jgi:hypothetical protein
LSHVHILAHTLAKHKFKVAPTTVAIHTDWCGAVHTDWCGAAIRARYTRTRMHTRTQTRIQNINCHDH